MKEPEGLTDRLDRKAPLGGVGCLPVIGEVATKEPEGLTDRKSPRNKDYIL